jgi:hypothetical protein
VRTGLIGCAIVLVGLSSAGCAGPSPGVLQAIAEDKQQATQVLETFAAGLRAKDPTLVEPLLSPTLDSGRKGELAYRFEQASWLEGYTYYEADIPASVDRVKWQNWSSGRARVGLVQAGSVEERMDVEVELARFEGRWHIRDFRLTEPRAKSVLDPPQAVTAMIMRQVLPVMAAIGEGRTGEVYYMVPKGARERRPKVSFFRRLLSPPRRVLLYTDLQFVNQLDFMSWPEPSELPRLTYIMPGVVAATYRIPHVWHGTGTTEPEYLTITFRFAKRREGWFLQHLGFSGEAIPGT